MKNYSEPKKYTKKALTTLVFSLIIIMSRLLTFRCHYNLQVYLKRYVSLGIFILLITKFCSKFYEPS